jgi:uncharacterized Ntn-hydrolase superfamily protein
MMFTRPITTYSIVARDPETGHMGVAVQSRYFSVGSVVPWAEAGIGAVATQSLANAAHGPDGLALMRRGLTAGQALAALIENDPGREVRQVAMVDARGNVAVHTGATCIAAAGHLRGDNVAVQANMAVDDSVWPAMKAGYEAASGDLAARLLAALEAAQAAGGDLRGQQSSALLVVSGERSEKWWEGRLFDLRVEDHPQPIEELKRLVLLRRAWQFLDGVAGHLAERQLEQARMALTKALDLAPEADELRIWLAVVLFGAGQEEEALLLFRDLFARAPHLADLVPRLAPLGLVPTDPVALKRIMDQRPLPD